MSEAAGENARIPEQGLLRDTERGARTRGIILIMAAVTLFSVLDVTAKVLGQRGIPVLEIVWARYAFHFVLAVIIFNPIASPTSWRVTRPFLQIVRAFMLVLVTALNFVAIRYLQLAETVSIAFLAPLLIAALSVVFLGEKVGPRRLAAIVVGFLGVLIVTRPGLGGFHWAMLFALGSVSCYSVYAILTRLLAGTETAGSMTLVLAGVPTVVLLPFMPAIWVQPEDWSVVGLMLLTGISGGLGHFLVITAHKFAPASALAPFSYFQLISMVAAGYIVFGDVPTVYTLVGASVIIASGLYLLHRERTVKATRTDPAMT